MRFLTVRALALGFCLSAVGPAQAEKTGFNAIVVADPGADLAAEVLGLTGPVQVIRNDVGVPGWDVTANGKTVGHLASTWQVAGSVGYSGRPLDVLVAISPAGRITGARLMQHNEPVLTLGISDADIAAYVSGFAGYDLTAPAGTGLRQPGVPDVISRATVST